MIIEWAESAFRCLEKISDYLVNVSKKDVAKKMTQGIYEKATTLRTFPLRGRIVSGVNDQKLREIFYERYRIIYEIDSLETPSKVIVLAVVHESQILENTLLADRLTSSLSQK